MTRQHAALRRGTVRSSTSVESAHRVGRSARHTALVPTVTEAVDAAAHKWKPPVDHAGAAKPQFAPHALVCGFVVACVVNELLGRSANSTLFAAAFAYCVAVAIVGRQDDAITARMRTCFSAVAVVAVALGTRSVVIGVAVALSASTYLWCGDVIIYNDLMPFAAIASPPHMPLPERPLPDVALRSASFIYDAQHGGRFCAVALFLCIFTADGGLSIPAIGCCIASMGVCAVCTWKGYRSPIARTALMWSMLLSAFVTLQQWHAHASLTTSALCASVTILATAWTLRGPGTLSASLVGLLLPLRSAPAVGSTDEVLPLRMPSTSQDGTDGAPDVHPPRDAAAAHVALALCSTICALLTVDGCSGRMYAVVRAFVGMVYTGHLCMSPAVSVAVGGLNALTVVWALGLSLTHDGWASPPALAACIALIGTGCIVGRFVATSPRGAAEAWLRALLLLSLGSVLGSGAVHTRLPETESGDCTVSSAAIACFAVACACAPYVVVALRDDSNGPSRMQWTAARATSQRILTSLGVALFTFVASNALPVVGHDHRLQSNVVTWAVLHGAFVVAALHSDGDLRAHVMRSVAGRVVVAVSAGVFAGVIVACIRAQSIRDGSPWLPIPLALVAATTTLSFLSRRHARAWDPLVTSTAALGTGAVALIGPVHDTISMCAASTACILLLSCRPNGLAVGLPVRVTTGMGTQYALPVKERAFAAVAALILFIKIELRLPDPLAVIVAVAVVCAVVQQLVDIENSTFVLFAKRISSFIGLARCASYFCVVVLVSASGTPLSAVARLLGDGLKKPLGTGGIDRDSTSLFATTAHGLHLASGMSLEDVAQTAHSLWGALASLAVQCALAVLPLFLSYNPNTNPNLWSPRILLTRAAATHNQPHGRRPRDRRGSPPSLLVAGGNATLSMLWSPALLLTVLWSRFGALRMLAAYLLAELVALSAWQ